MAAGAAGLGAIGLAGIGVRRLDRRPSATGRSLRRAREGEHEGVRRVRDHGYRVVYLAPGDACA